MKCIICGAGIAGLALAWWLGRQGWKVLLVERAPRLRDQGYGVDFFGPGYDAAECMGLLPLLERVRTPLQEIAYVDQRGHRLAGPSYELFGWLHHFRLLTLMRGDLERLLFEQLPSDEIEICFERTIDQVLPEDGRVRVLLDDGRAETADLVVGADGLRSRIRQLAFGAEEQFLRYLGFHTAAHLFQDAKIRSELRQNFVCMSAPHRWVGFYPLRDDSVSRFFRPRRTQPRTAS